MRILESADGGAMLQRLCGPFAAAAVEGILLSRVEEEAKISHDGPAVNMANMLQAALTGDQALLDAPPALVIRVGNMYEHEGNYFAVDARADWSVTDIAISVLDKPGLSPTYRVAAFVAHESDSSVEARQRMRSGHYTAFVLSDGQWFHLDDERVTSLDSPHRCSLTWSF